MTIDIFFTLNNRFNLGVSTKRSVAKEADQKQEKKRTKVLWSGQMSFIDFYPEIQNFPLSI